MIGKCLGLNFCFSRVNEVVCRLRRSYAEAKQRRVFEERRSFEERRVFIERCAFEERREVFIRNWTNKIYALGLQIKPHKEIIPIFVKSVQLYPDIFVDILKAVSERSNGVTAEYKNKLILSFLKLMPQELLQSVSDYLKVHQNYTPAYTEKIRIIDYDQFDFFLNGSRYLGLNPLWQIYEKKEHKMILEANGKEIKKLLNLGYVQDNGLSRISEKTWNNLEDADSYYKGGGSLFLQP